MSAQNCAICKEVCVFKPRPKENEVFGASCDSCCQTLCKKCANITTTEAHAVALTQRTLIFYCPECRCRSNDVPNKSRILNNLDSLKIMCKEKDTQIEILHDRLQEVPKDLRAEIDQLTVKNREKDSHIAKLRRRTQDFEDMVSEAEQDYIAKIKEQDDRISKLNREVINLLDLNKVQSQQIVINESKICKFVEEIKSLATQREHLQASIEKLTNDNVTLATDLKKTKYELLEAHTQKSIIYNQNQDHKEQVLIYKKNLNDQSTAIEVLNNEMSKLKESNHQLEEESNIACEIKNKLENDLEDLRNLSKDMISSIKTLENENKFLTDEISGLRHALEVGDVGRHIGDYDKLPSSRRAAPATAIPHEITSLKKRDFASGADWVLPAERNSAIQTEPTTVEGCNSNNVSSTRSSNITSASYQKNNEYKCMSKSGRILVFGDQSCRGWATRFRRNPEMERYEVLGITQPNADLKTLTNTIFNYAKNYSISDCVVISLDIRSITFKSFSNLRALLSIARFTNCIVVIKHHNFDSRCFKIYDYISKFNKKNNTSVKIVENYKLGAYFRHSTSSICSLLGNYVLAQARAGSAALLKSIFTDVTVYDDVFLPNSNNNDNNKCDLIGEISVPVENSTDISINNLSLTSHNYTDNSASSDPLGDDISNRELNVNVDFLETAQPPHLKK